MPRRLRGSLPQRGFGCQTTGREKLISMPRLRVKHTQIGIHLPKAGTFHIRLAYEPSYRLLNDILAAPTRLMPVTPQSQPSSDQLSIGDLPPICASTNTQEG